MNLRKKDQRTNLWRDSSVETNRILYCVRKKDGCVKACESSGLITDLSYVKFSKKSIMDASIVGKRVVSKVNNLRFYHFSFLQYEDVGWNCK